MSWVSHLSKIIKAELHWLSSTYFEKGNFQENTNHYDSNSEESYKQNAQNAQRQATSPLARAYAALEIPYGSDWDTIKKAHRQMVKKYHPDRYYDDFQNAEIATEILRQINEAYELLGKHVNHPS